MPHARITIADTPLQSLTAWAEANYPGFDTMTQAQRAIRLNHMVCEGTDIGFAGASMITDAKPLNATWTAFSQSPIDYQIHAFERDYPGGGLNCQGKSDVLAYVLMTLLGSPVWELHMFTGAAAHTVVLTEAIPG